MGFYQTPNPLTIFNQPIQPCFNTEFIRSVRSYKYIANLKIVQKKYSFK